MGARLVLVRGGADLHFLRVEMTTTPATNAPHCRQSVKYHLVIWSRLCLAVLSSAPFPLRLRRQFLGDLRRTTRALKYIQHVRVEKITTTTTHPNDAAPEHWHAMTRRASERAAARYSCDLRLSQASGDLRQNKCQKSGQRFLFIHIPLFVAWRAVSLKALLLRPLSGAPHLVAMTTRTASTFTLLDLLHQPH